MRKTALIISAIIVFLLPILILVLGNPIFSSRFPKLFNSTLNNKDSTRFSTKSEMPGYDLVIADPSYLDYLIDRMNIFGNQAIIDPRTHRGFPDLKLRYTISRIQFILVSIMDQPITVLMGRDSPTSMGGYSIDGNTLTLRIFLDIPQLTTGTFARNHALEDAFIRTVGFTLVRARSALDKQDDAKARNKIITDIDEYLYKNIFAWPVTIIPNKT